MIALAGLVLLGRSSNRLGLMKEKSCSLFFVASKNLSCSKQVSQRTGSTNDCLRSFCVNDVGRVGLAGAGAASGVNLSLGLGVSLRSAVGNV